MSEKTAGQVLYGNDALWGKCPKALKAACEKDAARLIAHVRPPIEAEARAAAIEDAIAAIRKRAECTLSDALEVADAVDAISALATTPAGHVCVPVGKTIPLDIAERELTDLAGGDSGIFLDEAIGVLRTIAMLAARPK